MNIFWVTGAFFNLVLLNPSLNNIFRSQYDPLLSEVFARNFTYDVSKYRVAYQFYLLFFCEKNIRPLHRCPFLEKKNLSDRYFSNAVLFIVVIFV